MQKNQFKMYIFLSLFGIFFIFTSHARSETIICEGTLVDINGNNVNKTMKLSFFINDAIGAKLWGIEKYINFKNGFFYTVLGKIKPIPPEFINNKKQISIGIVCYDKQFHLICNKDLDTNKVSINNVVIPCFRKKKQPLCSVLCENFSRTNFNQIIKLYVKAN